MFSSWSTPLASVSTATVWSTVKSPPVMLLIVPFICGGHHDFVQDGRRLLDGADHVATDNGGAGLHNGVKVPDALTVERGHLDAAGNVGAGQVADLGQRALDTVIDILQHTGPSSTDSGIPVVSTFAPS